MMEKIYCKHCKTLTGISDKCPNCGENDFQPIIISVQNNSQKESSLFEEY